MENTGDANEILSTKIKDCNEPVIDEDQARDNVSTDHVCERNYGDVLNIPAVDEGELYTCGGCAMQLATICRLHEHMLQEFITGSYIYDNQLKTAYEKVQCASIGTQTEDDHGIGSFQSDLDDRKPVRKRKKTTGAKKKQLKSTSKKKIDSLKQSKRTKLKTKTEIIEPVTEDDHENVSDIDFNEIENCQELDEVKHSDTHVHVDDNMFGETTEEEPDLPEHNTVTKEKQVLEAKNKKLKSGKLKGNKKFSKTVRKHSQEKEKGKYSKASDDIFGETTDEEYDLHEEDSNKTDFVNDIDIDTETEYEDELNTKDKPGLDANKLKSGKVKGNKKLSKIVSKHSGEKRKYEKTSDCEDEDSDYKEAVFKRRRGRPRIKPEKIECEHCENVFNNEKKLNIHLGTTHSLLYPYCCIPCNRKPFKTKEEFTEHKEQHPVQIFTCELCSKELRSKEGLRLHILAHSGVKPYMCDECDYRGRTTAQLRQHKVNHMTTKTEQCEHCGKAFFTKGKLKEHIKYCRKEFNHHCSYCQKGFPTASGLRKHVLMHTGERQFVCDVCGFATFRTSLLKSHMRTHTGEKPYKCKFCGAKLASRGTLRLHERTHTHEKPFVCPFCNKAFTSKWNLKTHLRQHTGETPYKCDICGQGFKQNVLRKSHMRCHMETVEPGGPSLHIEPIETPGPGGPGTSRAGTSMQHRMNEQAPMDIQQMAREAGLVDNQSHRLIEPPSHTPVTASQTHRLLESSHTPVPVMIQDHYNQSVSESGEINVKDPAQASEPSNHILPLDLKLHYSSSDYKNIYTSTVPAASSSVLSNSFNLINYSN